MAGLALIYAPDGAGPDHEARSGGALAAAFARHLQATAGYKHLETPAEWAADGGCLAARLDAPHSLQRGIVRHAPTGAWLLAAGTVIDTADPRPDGALERWLGDYLEHGAAALARLDGQFALAIFDPRQQSLALVADPFGMIPLYYGRAGGRWYVSTSALAVAQALHAHLDPLRARAFLLYGDLLGGTLWRDVCQLAPAAVLTLSPQGAAEQVYWRFELDEHINRLPESQALDCMLESFAGSMRRGLGREGQMWLSLTGGLDSRTLAALAAHSGLPFRSYCHGPTDCRDVRIAEKISRSMGWEHTYFGLPEAWGTERADWLRQAVGQSDGSLDALKLARTLREQTIKAAQLGVSLWGYGGEIYRGVYWKHEFGRAGRSTQVDYRRLFSYRLEPLDAGLLADGARWSQEVRAEMLAALRAAGEQQPGWPNTVKLDLIGLRMERPFCGGAVAAVLPQQRVPLPFYFKENLQRAISIHWRWRKHSRLFRSLLERVNPQLAAVETADGSPAEPMRLGNAHRFIPYWLDAGEKLAWKVGVKALGRPLWARRSPGYDGRAYPWERWTNETVARLAEEDVLQPERMCSAGLYPPALLPTLLDATQPITLPAAMLISRMITIELALRMTGTGC